MPLRKSLFSDNFVAPIVCTSCGHNAYCVRREPQDGRELQTFECAECHHLSTRFTENDLSDEEILKLAERQCGFRSA